MQATITQLQDDLIKGKIEQVLKKLQSIFSLSSSALVNDALALLARFKKANSDYRRGVIKYEDETLVINQVRDGIIELLEEIQNDPEKFQSYDKAETGLDQSIKERGVQPLTGEVKDVLFERLSDIKEKKIEFPTLWIDNFSDNITYEISILEAIGLKFDLATSSGQALELIQANNYQLLLSDIKRGTNYSEGFDFHKALLQKGIDIPLIFYTSSVDRSKGVPPYAFGIADLPNNLFHLVMDVIQRKY